MASCAHFLLRPSLPLASRLLLLSMLPMLTFFGHWSRLELRVPASDLAIVLWPGEAHAGHDDGHHHDEDTAATRPEEHSDHEQHCHVDAAGCSDVPLSTISSVLSLAATVHALGLTTHSEREILGAAWIPGAPWTLSPDGPPPRPLS